MYERIKKISELFNQEKDVSKNLNHDLLKKFDIFKKWLINNGAIFKKNIDFPYVYGPFNIIGCKSISEIKENESILLIPKKLMIISKELKYLDKLTNDIKDKLYNMDDTSTINLTLHLYLENKNKHSFFRPYLDLLFSNYNYLNDFTEENMKYFNEDDKIIESFMDTIENLDDTYYILQNSKYFKEMKKDDFLFCYSQVVTRQFYIDERCSALIPLADLLNHNNINVHYEFYDTENYIFKYTRKFSIDTDIPIDMRTTYMKEYPKMNDNKILLIEPISILKNEKKIKIVKIKENDYFSISTSKGETIKKDNQVFNNYFNGGNKYLLKYYGFCLINNQYDYTSIIINIETGKDILVYKYLEVLFEKKYKFDPYSFQKYLKIKIYYNEICFYLIKYYRFLYFYKEKNDMKQYLNYKFDISLEINFITLTIECLKLKLNSLNNCNNSNIENDLNELENSLFNIKENNINSFKINALIYRITQKRNIINQIELLQFLLRIMKKYKNKIKGYINLLDYENEFVNISQFDSDDNSKIKIINFLKKARNIIG